MSDGIKSLYFVGLKMNGLCGRIHKMGLMTFQDSLGAHCSYLDVSVRLFTFLLDTSFKVKHMEYR